jgi:hypothetical protein
MMDHWTRFRWRIRLMALIDWLLGTHLVEQVTGHWRKEIEAMREEISSLEASLDELDASRKAILRHLCLTYLQQRQTQSPENWLHFDPQDAAEESTIDVLTRALVSPHWARWKVTQVSAEDADLYTYDLVPDWEALRQDAVDRSTHLPSSLLAWLEEQMERGVGSRK